MEFSRRINGVLVSEEELRGLNVTNDTLEHLFYSAAGRALGRGEKENRADKSRRGQAGY